MTKRNVITTNRKLILIFEYILVAVMPVIILARAELREYSLPYAALLIWVLVVILIVWAERWSLNKLGLGFNNLRQGVGYYVSVGLISTVFMSIYAIALGKSVEQNLSQYWHFRFLFIPVSVFQEFIYRGFLLTTLKSILHLKILVIIINTLAFVMLHIFFPDFPSVLPMIIWFGLVMDAIYYTYPNLVAASIIHSCVNFLAVAVHWT